MYPGAKCYHQQFYLPVLRAICILKVFKHCEGRPIRSIYNMLIQSHWHCWEPVTKARPDEEKGCVKGKHFCHPKVTEPGLSAGDRGCQQDGCSYYRNTGNNSHWENGTIFGFLFHPSQRGGRRVVCHGGIHLAATCCLGFIF